MRTGRARDPRVGWGWARRSLWLLAALVLVLLAGGLLWLDERQDPGESAVSRQIEFPRYVREEERQRQEARLRPFPRAVLPVPAEGDVAQDEAADPPPQDPLHLALAAAGAAQRSSVVIEANVLRHSPVGELLLGCLGGEASQELKQLQQKHGLDLLEHLDRVAVGSDLLLLSGFFQEVDWSGLLEGKTAEPLGERAVLYRLAEQTGTADPDPSGAESGADPRPEAGWLGPGDQLSLAVWNQEMVMVGSEEQVRQALDRLEGRSPAVELPYDANQAYGEVYGRIAIEDALGLLGEEEQQHELARRFRQAVERLELHLDARSDLALVLEADGREPRQLEELARSLGGALSLLRMKARAEDERELAELLDWARVEPQDGGGFTLELALPLSFFRRQLGECARQGPGWEEQLQED